MTDSYTLEALQKLFNRTETAVSKNARPLVTSKLKEPWQDIMTEAVKFVNTSYEADNVPLSVRQVHYHMIHSNTNYLNDAGFDKKLSTYFLRARIGGLIPWNSIVESDSTVTHEKLYGLDPKEAIERALKAAPYMTGKDPWDEMGLYPLVVSEKRELEPQLAPTVNKFFVRLTCTRGYGMWSRLNIEQRLIRDKLEQGFEPIVFFVTDHDPSGLDINRFAASVLVNYWKLPIKDVRVMLTKTQINKYSLPHAPTKVKDPRAKGYMSRYGHEAWEVDALGKARMQQMLEKSIKSVIDKDIWARVLKDANENRRITQELAEEHLDR